MKRTLLTLLLVAVLTTAALTPTASAASAVPGRTVSAAVNGRTVTSEALLRQGVTYVPIRSLLNALGSWDIQWERGTRSAVVSGSGHCAVAVTGSRTLYLNGERLQSPHELFVSGGATYVPLRLLAEGLGLSVRWNGQRQRAEVSGTLTPRSGGAEELYWLSRIISAESRAESLAGQIAVGNVVLNRRDSAAFPDTVKDVIFETSHGYVQFEPVSNGTVHAAPTALSITAAVMALAGYNTAGESLYFFAPALSSGAWIRSARTYYTTIGCHRFYL